MSGPQASYDTQMKRCPACSTVFFRQKVAGITGSTGAMLDIDGCAGCGGAWLDDGKLSALGKAPAALAKAAASIRATQPALAPQRSGACPNDGAALAPVEYPAFAGLSFLGCGTCRGVFCENGVLSALADRLAPATLEPVHSRAERAGLRGTAEPVLAADGGVAIPIGRHAVIDDPTSTAGLPLVRALPAPPFQQDAGFFARFSRGFAFIRAAYALAFEKTTLLVPTVISGGVSLVFSAGVLGTLFLLFAASGGFASANAGNWPHAHRVLLFLVGAVWTIGNYFIAFFFMGMTMSMIDAYLKGREPELGVAFRDSLKNVAGILQLAVVSFLVSLVIGMVRGNQRSRGIGGAIFDGVRGVIAKAIEEAWTVLTFLLLPVIMIEDIQLKDAVARVRTIHAGNLMQIAVGEIGLALVSRAIGFVVMLLAIGMAFPLFAIGKGGIIAWVIGLVGLLTIIGVLQSFARAAYYTCLYLWAVEVEKSGANAKVPAPLALALSR